MFNRKLPLYMLLLAACAPAALPTAQPQPEFAEPAAATPRPPRAHSAQTTSYPTDESPAGAESVPAPTNVRVEDDREFNFPQLLPYDGIRPVYTPEIVSAQVAPLLDEELVMGVLHNGAAKAYPVSVLRFREMVDDELGGIPILVTW